MELEKNNLWIVGGYYIDFDELEQFRIIGPNNHLYCGLIDIPRHKIKIYKVEALNGGNSVKILGIFPTQKLNLYYPAMDDIRTMRMVTQVREKRRFPFVSFLEIRRTYFDKLVPFYIRYLKKENKLSFRRYYGEKYWYGVTFQFPHEVKIENISHPYKGYRLSTKKKGIKFEIIASTNDINKCKIKHFFIPRDFDFKIFGKDEKIVKKIWKRTAFEIEHLITWGKTSGDRFGTIFPRDWMEAADLGVHDLTDDVRDYMYEVCLKNVNKKGESWHEDVVGEYRFQHEIAGRDIFDRHMIDIEPHHIMGLKQLSQNFLVKKENKEKVQLIAKYLVEQARKNDLIIFKRKSKEGKNKEEYYYSGNWRDSEWAFKKIHPVIAPFDVNVVFYPEALKVLRDFQKKLSLEIQDIDTLIKKWMKVKKFYQFQNDDQTQAYALALYDIKKGKGSLKYKKMKVNHLDESYLFTYSDGNPREIESFCKRLLSQNYFYTNSGPMLIAKNNPYGYTTQEYHGLVIWTKQVAYVVLGLSKHLKKAIVENWDKKLQKLIRKTLLITCQNMIKTYAELGGVPELHFDDRGKAKYFTDQENVLAHMSKVQLWSAIGARRIIRKYYELMTEERYKI